MSHVVMLYTRQQYNLLPEGFPAQLVEGQLVQEPPPSLGHQRIAGEIYRQLYDLVGSRRAVMAPADVPVDDFNVFQPDVVVVRAPLPDEAKDVGIPLIAIEVLSPSTEARDRRVKRIRLLDAGVQEVWLVDPAQGTIEVYDRLRYRDAPRRATGGTEIGSATVPGFALTPSRLFAP